MAADERADLRQFMREMMLRADRVTDRIVRQLDQSTRRVEQGTRQLETLTRATEELTRELRVQRAEFVAESRAGREALFRVLDRLPPPRGDAAA